MEKSDITDALIARGYFRSEIPRVITSAKFAEWCRESADCLPDLLDSIAKHDKKNKLPKRRPEQYSAAEYGFRRRNMLIPNPIDQLALVRVIAENWREIERHYEKSGISKSKQKILPLDESPRWATRITRHTELESERMLAMAGYSHILQTDIGRFFPSFYTHSVSWAIDGKDNVKADIKNKSGRWSDHLDRQLRQCNDGQTSGIAIGPATSHIVAEILMSSIDEQLQRKMEGRLKGGYRHVDDYFLCFDSEKDAEAALAAIQQAAATYELSVNAEKTKIMKSADYIGDSWQIQLVMMDSQIKARIANAGLATFASAALTNAENRSSSIFAKLLLIPLRFMFPLRQTEILECKAKEWMMQFAAQAFAFAQKYPNASVMKYALEILRKLPSRTHLSEEDWNIYQNILTRIMTSYPYTTDKVANIFRRYKVYILRDERNKRRLSDAVSALIKRHAPLEHHSEVAWALWLAKVVGLDIEDEAAKCLLKVNSGVCALLALDNMKNGRIKLGMDETPWRKHMSPEGLRDRFWLLAYEAPHFLDNKSSYIDDNEFFAQLKAGKVRFYDEDNDDAYFDDSPYP